MLESFDNIWSITKGFPVVLFCFSSAFAPSWYLLKPPQQKKKRGSKWLISQPAYRDGECWRDEWRVWHVLPDCKVFYPWKTKQKVRRSALSSHADCAWQETHDNLPSTAIDGPWPSNDTLRVSSATDRHVGERFWQASSVYVIFVELFSFLLSYWMFSFLFLAGLRHLYKYGDVAQT